MSSSYFVTYGTDRLTFPGVTGSVAWQLRTASFYKEIPLYTIPSNLTDEQVRAVTSINLPSAGSAFDMLKVSYGTCSDLNSAHNTFTNKMGIHTVYVSPKYETENRLALGGSFYPGNTGSYRMYAVYTGIKGATWTWASGFNSLGASSISTSNNKWIYIQSIAGCSSWTAQY